MGMAKKGMGAATKMYFNPEMLTITAKCDGRRCAWTAQASADRLYVVCCALVTQSKARAQEDRAVVPFRLFLFGKTLKNT